MSQYCAEVIVTQYINMSFEANSDQEARDYIKDNYHGHLVQNEDVDITFCEEELC